MPPILSHLSYFFMSLVGPTLFTAWIVTGPKLDHGFYNLYATYVVCCTTYVSIGLLALWLNEAQQKPWRFQKSRELLKSKSYITYFSYLTSVVIMITLVWYAKFFTAFILLLHVMLTAWIRHLFLGNEDVHLENKVVEEPQLGTMTDEKDSTQTG